MGNLQRRGAPDAAVVDRDDEDAAEVAAPAALPAVEATGGNEVGAAPTTAPAELAPPLPPPAPRLRSFDFPPPSGLATL